MESHLRQRGQQTTNRDGDEVSYETSAHSESFVNSATLNRDNWLYVLALAILVRTFNSFTITTYFQPDEYYQALEPAHHFVFGYGYVTWEWKEALRSSLHPYLYIIGYKIALCLNEDAVYYAPKLIGGLIGALGDAYTYSFVLYFTQNWKIARIALLLSFLSPFNWHVITRSFSNSFEMVLTTIALAHWHLESFKPSEFTVACLVAMLTCIVRPTNAIIWLVLGIKLILSQTPKESFKLVIHVLSTLIATISITSVLDFTFYGYWTFPLYNFIEFNVVKNLSIFYGEAPWHFYIFQAIPLIHMAYLPVFLYSCYMHQWYKHVYGIVCFFTLGLFSLVGHKEFRFIYPLQPIFMLFTAVGVHDLVSGGKRFVKPCIVVIVLLNIFTGYFFTRVNEKGVIDIIAYIREEPVLVGFLMPCHSTPWQSHLHNQFFESSWFLTCEPPLHLEFADTSQLAAYMDESDRFFDEPEAFLESLGDRKSWPACLVVFEPMEKLMDRILPKYGYSKNRRFFNSYFHWDPRRSGDLVFFCT